MTKSFLIVSILCILTNAQDEHKKVVYDLTTGSIKRFQKSILKGIVMHKNYFQNKLEDLDVSVVIHGNAYKFFLKEIEHSPYAKDKKLTKNYKELQKRIVSLHNNYDVEFMACEVRLKAQNIKQGNLLPFVQVIPNSTVGLIEKQNAGYAYLPIGDK